MAKEDSRFTVELVLDLDEVSVLELGDLLHALNNVAVRSILAWLRGNVFNDNRPKGATEANLKEALEVLASSYCAYSQRQKRELAPWVMHQAAWGIFEDALPEDVFASWVRWSLRQNALTTKSIKEGNSIVIALGFAGIAALTCLPVDYSLIKDIVSFHFNWLREALRKPRPRDTLASVAELMDVVTRMKGVEEITLRVDGEEIELLVKAERRHSKSIGKGPGRP